MSPDELREAKAAYHKCVDTLLSNLQAPEDEWMSHIQRMPLATRRYRDALAAAARGEFGDAPLLEMMQAHEDMIHDLEEAAQHYSWHADHLISHTSVLLIALEGYRGRQRDASVDETS